MIFCQSSGLYVRAAGSPWIFTLLILTMYAQSLSPFSGQRKPRCKSHRVPWVPAASPARHPSSHQDASVPRVPSREAGWEIRSAHRVSSARSKAEPTPWSWCHRGHSTGQASEQNSAATSRTGPAIKCTYLNQPVTTEKMGFPTSSGSP